jgi:hypothetical protein
LEAAFYMLPESTCELIPSATKSRGMTPAHTR